MLHRHTIAISDDDWAELGVRAGLLGVSRSQIVRLAVARELGRLEPPDERELALLARQMRRVMRHLGLE